MKVSASFRASSLCLPIIMPSIMSAEAWEIAQPSPVKAPSEIVSPSSLSSSSILSPQLGVYSVEGYVGGVDFVFEIGVDVAFG